MREKFVLMILSMFAGMGIFLLAVSTQAIGVNISACNPDTVSVKEVQQMFDEFTSNFFVKK